LIVREVPASLDTWLACVFSPATGNSAFYAAVSPLADVSPTWFLHGTVTTTGRP
jgi:hypothetical protein